MYRYFLPLVVFVIFANNGCQRSQFLSKTPLIQSISIEEFTEKDLTSVLAHIQGNTLAQRHQIFRTKEEKEGVYFMLYLNRKTNQIPSLGKVRVEVQFSQEPEPRQFDFKFEDEFRGLREIGLGLTGADALLFNEHKMVAWRVSLLNFQNGLIAQKSSYLW